MASPREPVYVCGHSAHELERLAVQGTFFEDITRRVLVASGLGRGMRVLDIGCGTGDLSLLAAELVGPDGSVLGIDRTPEALSVAAARAASEGVRQAHFRRAAIEELPTALGDLPPFDGVIGRFVLMHQADPAAALGTAARCARAGGRVAAIESHMAGCCAGAHSFPHSATYERIVGWLTSTVRAAGAHRDMGFRLRRVFLDAGLPAPELRLETRLDGGADAPTYRYVAESLRSMLPMARELGITALDDGDIEALERQLRDEVVASGGVLASWPIVGAWCTLL